MGVDFDTFQESALGAFVESPLGERNPAPLIPTGPNAIYMWNTDTGPFDTVTNIFRYHLVDEDTGVPVHDSAFDVTATAEAYKTVATVLTSFAVGTSAFAVCEHESINESFTKLNFSGGGRENHDPTGNIDEGWDRGVVVSGGKVGVLFNDSVGVFPDAYAAVSFLDTSGVQNVIAGGEAGNEVVLAGGSAVTKVGRAGFYFCCTRGGSNFIASGSSSGSSLSPTDHIGSLIASNTDVVYVIESGATWNLRAYIGGATRASSLDFIGVPASGHGDRCTVINDYFYRAGAFYDRSGALVNTWSTIGGPHMGQRVVPA